MVNNIIMKFKLIQSLTNHNIYIYVYIRLYPVDQSRYDEDVEIPELPSEELKTKTD